MARTYSFIMRAAGIGVASSLATGIPGIKILAAQISQQLHQVSVRKKQCKALGGYCVHVAQVLNDAAESASGPLSPAVQDAINKLWQLFVDINDQSLKWQAYNSWLGFLYHTEIQEFITKSRTALSEHLYNLGLLNHAQQGGWDAHFNQASEQDKESLLATEGKQVALDAKTKELQARLSEVQDGTIRRSNAAEAQWIKDRLYELRTQPPEEESGAANALPSRELTKSEVRKKGDRPLHVGDTYDIWLGRLYDKEDVVIKIFRGALPSSDGSQPSTPGGLSVPDRQNQDNERRWNRQVDIWRSLRHENILQLYGVVLLPPSGHSSALVQKKAEVALVTPYMKNRDADKYFGYKNTATLGADRIKFIVGMAKGLKYLHSLGIVHGGLQGSKVLVADDGSAILSDFSVSKLMSDNPLFTGNQGATQAVRWLAPEASENQVLTAQADVYSWAMTALQVLSGRPPFYKKKTVGSLIIAFRDQAVKPERGDYPREQIDDNLWDLLTACWTHNPKERPTIDGVLKALEAIKSPGA